MKKILLALTMIGMIHYSAEAKPNSKKHNYNENYQVCKLDNAYTICGETPTPATMTPASVGANTNILPTATENVQSAQTNQASPSYTGNYQQHNIAVFYDDPRNPYEGLPSRQDDGPGKNEERNLNFNQTSVTLPPVNGENKVK
jgi:hypothetical protein